MIGSWFSKGIHKKGFTIAELLVVIAVIGILATIVVVAYGGWKKTVIASQVQSDLNGLSAALESSKNFNGGYPTTTPAFNAVFTTSNGTTFTPTSLAATSYCVDAKATSDTTITYYLASETKDKGPQTGTCASRPGTTTLAAPTGLGVTSISATQIGLSWTAATGANSYVIQCATDASFTVGVQSTTVSAPTTTGTITGLQPVSTHYCHAKSTTTAGGDSGYSSSVKADTTTYLPPTGLAVTTAANTTLTLGWTANADASGYNVQCALDTGFTSGVQTAASSTTSATVSSLTPNSPYYCRANATNTTGTPSAYSAYITTSTTANFGTIAAATGLSTSSMGPASGNFSWSGISCSLGTPYYRFTWVSPQTSSTAWSTSTGANGLTFPQQTTSTWKVQTKCTYSGLDSSITDSATSNFTSTGTADPVGAFGTVGWNGRWQFNVSSSTYTCTSPAVMKYQLIATLIDYTSGSWGYGEGTSTTMSVTNANQGARMTTYITGRCILNGIASNQVTTSPRTDAASIDAPGTVPGWCAGSCGSPRGDRWSAVGCPAGTTALYWSYLVGDYSNPVWGAYEAAGFYGYDRGYYNYGNTMLNDYLMARCKSDFQYSGYGPQSYARY